MSHGVLLHREPAWSGSEAGRYKWYFFRCLLPRAVLLCMALLCVVRYFAVPFALAPGLPMPSRPSCHFRWCAYWLEPTECCKTHRGVLGYGIPSTLVSFSYVTYTWHILRKPAGVHYSHAQKTPPKHCVKTRNRALRHLYDTYVVGAKHIPGKSVGLVAFTLVDAWSGAAERSFALRAALLCD